MAAQKPIRVEYQAKSNRTGLTDVKAQVYLNGVGKAVGPGALTLVELDAANSPGLYELVISATLLTSWGVNTTGPNVVAGYITSATAPAYAPFFRDLNVASIDDLDTHLTSQDTAIAAVKADTAAIKVDLETGPAALNVLSTKLDKILNNSGFALAVPEQLLRPASGSNPYRITQTFYDDQNEGLVDVDGNAVLVTLTNQAGADRSQYLVGYQAGAGGAPGSAPAVRDSQGQYHVDLAIPSTAAQEQLNFVFSYAIRGQATARKATSVVITDVQAQGFALQSTLVDVQTRTTDVQSKVNDATFGLAAAQTLQAAIKTQTDKLGDGSIGLAALKSALAALQLDVTNNVEGSGFISAQDSLHAISTFLTNNLVMGGRAV